MSAAYGSAVRKHLPKAGLVFDRFHLVKLVHDEARRAGPALVREAALRDNEPLLKGYLLKVALCELWNQPEVRSARRYFHQWLQMAQDTGIALQQRPAMTFRG